MLLLPLAPHSTPHYPLPLVLHTYGPRNISAVDRNYVNKAQIFRWKTTTFETIPDIPICSLSRFEEDQDKQAGT